MSEYKLYYFDGRGIGEGIRLLFNYVGQPFEDIRFNMENWGENKSSMLTFEALTLNHISLELKFFLFVFSRISI